VRRSGATLPPPAARRRVARLVTEALAPVSFAAVMPLAVVWWDAPGPLQALGWWLVAVVFTVVLPMGFVLRGVRRGRLSDHHIGVRAQRPVPLLVGMASVTFGLVLLVAAGAPADLVALVAAMVGGLVVSLLVTLRWKISLHTGVAAGSVAVAALAFGPALLALSPVVGLVGWSRVQLGDHTAAQTVAGAGLGAAVAALVFSLLR
jgi:membrane-associated phospholipid phosphatase